ncbi:hypothetical protein LR48_Vigan07g148100 [Vigna angularis]|uniref:Uncharacterized protein n=1 Tax=Phaseolus angularis TaxID=3914 RepID=A0A0L9UYV9_PHAAN|nr:hypothetical protein LR48_Vigan07g148100 [Vigna angularis]
MSNPRTCKSLYTILELQKITKAQAQKVPLSGKYRSAVVARPFLPLSGHFAPQRDSRNLLSAAQRYDPDAINNFLDIEWVGEQCQFALCAQLQSIHKGQVATAEMIVGLYDTPPTHRWTMDEFHQMVAWPEERAQGSRAGAAEASTMEEDEDDDDDGFEDVEDDEEEEDTDDSTG